MKCLTVRGILLSSHIEEENRVESTTLTNSIMKILPEGKFASIDLSYEDFYEIYILENSAELYKIIENDNLIVIPVFSPEGIDNYLRGTCCNSLEELETKTNSDIIFVQVAKDIKEIL